MNEINARKNSLQTCTPCKSEYGSRTCDSATSSDVAKWRTYANTAGKAHGVNPVCLLAVAAVETNGEVLGGGGIVQIGSTMLKAYNKWKGTSYTTSDLEGTGKLCNTDAKAVTLGFDILGRFLEVMLGKTNSLKLAATSWNGCICGKSGDANVFGKDDYAPIASGASCYGEAVYKVAAAYSGWWINPDTQQASSFYFADLAEVDPSVADLTQTLYYGEGNKL